MVDDWTCYVFIKKIYKAIGKKVGGGRGGTLNQHIWRERERDGTNILPFHLYYTHQIAL